MSSSISTDLLGSPIRIFWTPYDPLDLVSDSIDPLGFARGYLALADRLLPSFTTVSAQPRYVSLLCAATRAAQRQCPGEPGLSPARLRQERLQRVKSYERAWALACGLASRVPDIGPAAVQGLRGVRSVQRRLETLPDRGTVQTSSYNLLSDQVRYGGLGVYSVFFEECHLGSMQTFSLRPLGEELAKAFPSPGKLPVHDEDAKLPVEALRGWGKEAHLAAFTAQEGKVLARALEGGEEVGHQDDVRWAVLRLLGRLDLQGRTSESEILRGIGESLAVGEGPRLGVSVGVVAQLRTVLRLIEPFEQFYQAILFLFESLRAAATDEVAAPLKTATEASSWLEAAEQAPRLACDLLAAVEEVRAIDGKTAGDVGGVFRDSGILDLADRTVLANAVALPRLLVERHERVQSGKFDHGQRKAPWLRLEGATGRVRLTAQRHQLPVSIRPERWTDVGRHPYRTTAALPFVRACRIGESRP